MGAKFFHMYYDNATMISIKDIARMAGVSPSTVSRVLNNRDYVRADIREKVQALVREHGYVQNQVARSMVLQRTFTIGIVIPDTFNMFQRQLFATIERNLGMRGYRTMFFFLNMEEGSEDACLNRLRAESLDGVIMMHEVQSERFYQFLLKSGKPVALCTFERPTLNFPSVYVDEVAAARLAGDYLIRLGHRTIGLLSGRYFSFSALRRKGFLSALEAGGLAFTPDAEFVTDAYNSEAGRQGMLRLLEKHLPITAVFAITDELAIGAMRAVFEAGLRVPDDISVIGFDDIDISAFMTPGLSTIHQPIKEMGEETASLICAMIDGQSIPNSLPRFYSILIERESTIACTSTADFSDVLAPR